MTTLCPTGLQPKCISGLTLANLVLDWFYSGSRGMWLGIWALVVAPSTSALEEWGFHQARSGQGR